MIDLEGIKAKIAANQGAGSCDVCTIFRSLSEQDMHDIANEITALMESHSSLVAEVQQLRAHLAAKQGGAS